MNFLQGRIFENRLCQQLQNVPVAHFRTLRTWKWRFSGRAGRLSCKNRALSVRHSLTLPWRDDPSAHPSAAGSDKKHYAGPRVWIRAVPGALRSSRNGSLLFCGPARPLAVRREREDQRPHQKMPAQGIRYGPGFRQADRQLYYLAKPPYAKMPCLTLPLWSLWGPCCTWPDNSP